MSEKCASREVFASRPAMLKFRDFLLASKASGNSGLRSGK